MDRTVISGAPPSHIYLFICLFSYLFIYLPILVAVRSKAWVCGRSLAGNVGSNPACIMDVCLLWVLCVVR
jgi:hypothetical protein